MSFFERLREERERLGLSQEKFGAIGGVLKRAQINYEKGERHPDSTYLTAIAAAGADVLFILTGQRMGYSMSQSQSTGAALVAAESKTAYGAVRGTQLTPRQAALLDNYEHTDEQGKQIIEAAAFAAAKPKTKRKSA